MRWLKEWPEVCRGIHVGQLRRDLEAAIAETRRLGPARMTEFDQGLLQARHLEGFVKWTMRRPREGMRIESADNVRTEKPSIQCDRCGAPMIDSHCKIVCLNCGSRLDCSDLSIYLD